MAEPILHVQRDGDAAHYWIGPVGVHLFRPDFWKSRLSWCANWRETIEWD